MSELGSQARRMLLRYWWNQTYTEGPEPKYDDDKVDRVGKKHQHVDVCDCAVLWVDQVMEELPHGKVDLHEPARKEDYTAMTKSKQQMFCSVLDVRA